MPALPSLVKTYSVRANTPFQANTSALALHQSATFSLKQHMTNLMTGGTTGGASRHANSVWSVLGSSNSTTAGLDATDRWTAYTDCVFAANGVAHSWIVLRNTALGYDVCIDCINTTGNFSFTLTESSTPFTGGSTTTRPASTLEFSIATAAVGAGTLAAFTSDTATGNSNWTHYVSNTTDGTFHFLCSRTGLGVFSTYLAVHKTTGNNVLDTRNVFLTCFTGTAGRGVPTATQMYINTAMSNRNPNGTVFSFGGVQGAPVFGSTSYAGATGLDALSGDYWAFPVNLFSLGSQPCYRGLIPDIALFGAATVGASYPSTVAQTHVLVADLLVPFPVVNPLV